MRKALLAIIITASSVTSASFVLVPAIAHAATAVNVWWPANNAQLDATQPFKAVVDSKSLADYSMYWQVDGGGLVKMYDSQADYPHKEAMVDLTSWNWNSSGTYSVTFVAKDNSGGEIARTTVTIRHGNPNPLTNPTAPAAPATTTVAPAPAETARLAIPVWYVSGTTVTVKTVTPPATTVAPAPTPAPVAAALAPTPTSAPVVTAASGLYVDPNNPALAQAKAWAASRPADSAKMAKIGAQSSGIWLGGWNANVANDVKTAMAAAATQNSIPTFVAYNIPGRDCGSYSAGGASNSSDYLAWIRNVSAGLGSGKAIVILEPDGLASIDCLSDAQKTDRYSMLSQALDIFKANNPGTKVYIDAGHSGWVDANEMANRLTKAGVAKSAGFALNVSNFVSTAENVAYGTNVSKAANSAHFIVDTSRNGSGSNGEWCNPSGRSLGQAPTLSTGNPIVDAFLWVKKPGESDGTCNGGPSAGTWWSDYALGLATRAGY